MYCTCNYLPFSLELTVNSLNGTNRSRVWIHAVQLIPQTSFRENETVDTLSLEPGATSTTIIPVHVSDSAHTCYYIIVN